MKLNQKEEALVLLVESNPPKRKGTEDEINSLTKELLDLLVATRDSIPTSSVRFKSAMVSLIVSLNTFLKTPILNVSERITNLSISYTQYNYLMQCTRIRNPNRDSILQHKLHTFLKSIYPYWDTLLSQYLDYHSKH